jgi:hypothetical protein
MKMAVFWDAAPCCLVDIDCLTFQRCLLPPSSGHDDDAGSKHIRNFSYVVSRGETMSLNCGHHGAVVHLPDDA